MIKEERILKRGISSLIILCVILCIFGGNIYAASITDAERKRQEIEDRLNSVNNSIGDVKEKKQEAEAYIQQLDLELTDISAKLEVIENKLSIKKNEIQQTQQSLENARVTEAEQFENMKMRIRYIYETRADSFLDILFASESMAEFINQADYVRAMTDYDRKKLKEYKETKNYIEQKELLLQKEQKELDSLQLESIKEQESIQLMLGQKSAESAFYAQNLLEAEQEADGYAAQIAEQDAKIELLQEEERRAEMLRLAEEARLEEQNRRAAAGKPQVESDGDETTEQGDGASVEVSADDLQLMAAIIHCEAGGEIYVGRVAVGNVVMNRVKSSSFPNTILGVIYQKGQFTPVSTGKFSKVLAAGNIDSGCMEAAKEALSGRTNVVGGRLFFRTIVPGYDGLFIGNHVFY